MKSILMKVCIGLSILCLFACPMPNDTAKQKPAPVVPAYTVEYKANLEGSISVPVDSNTYMEADTVIIRDLVKGIPGFVFKGWTLDPQGSGAVYKAEDIFVMPAENVVFYAQWELASFSVTYHINDGSIGSDVQSFNYNDSITIRTNSFINRGYKFIGWNTNALGQGLSYAAGDTVQLTASINLYAQWEKADITITLDANGGDGEPVEYYAKYLESFIIPAVPFTKFGHGFNYWRDNASNTGNLYNSGSTYSVGSEDVRLYAYWYPKYYNVILHSNNGTTDSQAASVQFGKTFTFYLYPASNEGHDFVGWNTQEDGEGDNYNIADSFTLLSEGREFYAKWEPKTYKVSFTYNDGVSGTESQYYLYGSIITIPEPKVTPEGKEFDHWDVSDGTSAQPGDSLTVGAGDISLFARWNYKPHVVEYHANGGMGDSLSIDVKYNDSIRIAENPFSRLGYSFVGWSIDANASNGEYWENESVLIGDSDLILYAVWSAKSYYLFYDSNGADSGSISQRRIVFGDSITVAAADVLQKEHYDFIEWNTDINGLGTSYAPGGRFKMTIEGDTLYAIWKKKSYALEFNSNGGQGTMSSQSIIYNEIDKINSNAFTRTGYSFAGWNTQANGLGSAYADTADFTMTESGDTLYAIWTPNTYAVNFFKNDGSPVQSTQSAVYDQRVALDANTFIREHYVFDSWNTDAAGNGDSFADKASFNFTYENIDLYAIWEPVTYTLSFDVNADDGYNSMSDQSMQYMVPTQVRRNNFTRTGYTHSGWIINVNGTDTLYEPDSIVQISGNSTAYAQWEHNYYTLSYNGNGAETNNVPSQQIQYLIGTGSVADPTGKLSKEHSVFVKWNTASSGNGTSYNPGDDFVFTSPANDILYAIWTPAEYDLTLKANGGVGDDIIIKVPYQGTAKAGAGSFTRPGYSIAGWSTTPTGAVEYSNTADVTMNSAGKTLYAVWTANTYTITFSSGGHGGVYQSIVYNTPTNLKACTYEYYGYDFAGWNTQEDGNGTPYADEAEFTLTTAGGITLYAQWEPWKYYISFDSNTGTGEMDDVVVPYNSSAIIPECLFSKPGYVFVEWSTDTGNLGLTYKPGDETTIIFEDDVLYAKWEPEPVLISFDINGGIGSCDPVSGTPGKYASLPTADGLSKYGHNFYRWNTKQDGTGNDYNDGTSYYPVPDEGTVLYAIWNPDTYAVRFENNGGFGSPLSQNIEFGQSEALRSESFSKKGHRFSHWNTQDDGLGDSYADGALFTMTTEGITLYAIWELDTFELIFRDNYSYPYVTSTQNVLYSSTIQLPKDNFTREHYQLVSWNTNSNGNGTDYVSGTDFTLLEEGDTLYAIWEKNTYTVTFDSNTGSGSMDSVSGLYNEDVAIPASSFTKTNYVVGSWNTDPEGKGDKYYAEGFVRRIDSNKVLYAQWEPVTVTISFNANGGTGSKDSIVAKYGEKEILGQNEGITRLGYYFNSWNTKSDGTGESLMPWSTQITVPGHDVEYFAIWKFRDDINVYLYSNDENASIVATVNGAFFSTVTLPETIPERSGYTFVAWTRNQDGSGTQYLPGGSYTIDSEDYDLYAIWE